MKIKIDDELRIIIKDIINQNKSENDWKENEASDMFQSEHYCGGYDSIESSFCFSYYKDDKEFWFQITLEECYKIFKNEINEIHLKPIN